MHSGRAFSALAVFTACLVFVLALAGCTESYAPQQKTPTVQPPAVGEAGVLRVGVDASSYPLAGEVGGSIKGLNVDIAAALADEMGLKLRLVDTGVDGQEALSQGTVDLVMGADRNRFSADVAWFSEDYLKTATAVFSMDAKASMPDGSSMPVIGAQSSSMSAWHITQEYGSAAVKAFDDLKPVFQDLVDGGVSYAASDAVVGSYVLSSLGAEATIVGTLGDVSGYCVAVGKDNSALQLAVTQAFSAIQGDGIYDVILKKWLGGPLDLDVQKASEGQGETPAEQPAAEGGGEQAPAEGPAPEEPSAADAAPAADTAPAAEDAPVAEGAPSEPVSERSADAGASE